MGVPNRKSNLDLFPIRHVLRAYNYVKLRADVKAGLNVALLDFPQGMAYALIAGLPIQFGIYCSAIASLVGPIFASSRFLMLGPTNATAVLLLTAFLSLNLTAGQAVTVLPLIVLMVGCFIILASLFRLAGIVRYVSRSVMSGYVTAAACMIIINQVSTVFGFSRPKASTFIEVFQATLEHFEAIHFPTFIIAGVTFVVFIAFKRYAKKLPYVAGTLVVVTVLAFIFKHLGYQLEYVSSVSTGGWDLTLPPIDYELIRDLGGAALALAFLAIIESSSVSKTLAAKGGDRLDINQQMLSVGVANVASAFASGMTVSGSLARSQLNFESGAKTQISSIVSGLILAVGVLFLGPFFGFIPKAALAVIVIMVGISLFHWGLIRTIVSATRQDAVVFLITLVCGLIFTFESAIFIGVGVSILFFLKQAGTPQLVEFAFNEEGELAEKTPKSKTDMPEISIVHVEGDIFFGSTDIFLEQARMIVQDENLRVIILRMRNAHNIDATSAMAIVDLARFARSEGRDVIVSGALPEVEAVFRNSGLMNEFGEDNFFPYIVTNPNLSTRNALKRAQVIMGEKSANIKLFVKPSQDDQPFTPKA